MYAQGTGTIDSLFITTGELQGTYEQGLAVIS